MNAYGIVAQTPDGQFFKINPTGVVKVSTLNEATIFHACVGSSYLSYLIEKHGYVRGKDFEIIRKTFHGYFFEHRQEVKLNGR